MRTANPALSDSVFLDAERAGAEPMTLPGTVNKCFLLLLILLAPAAWMWSRTDVYGAEMMPWVIGGALGGLAVAIVTIFKKTWAPFTAPLYAALEGLVLGGLSALFEAQFPGIVVQAVAMTFGTLGALLLAYRSGLIEVTQNFRLGVVAATGGIFLVYLVDLGLNLFTGASVPFVHQTGLVGIGFSLFVVVIAALNLVLDFDFIERGVEQGAPKYMEWYAAFGLLVTLVWLYLEILRLLAKLRSR